MNLFTHWHKTRGRYFARFLSLLLAFLFFFLLLRFTAVANWWGHSKHRGNTECDFIILINLPHRTERRGWRGREREQILFVGFALDVCVCLCMCALEQRGYIAIFLGGKYPWHLLFRNSDELIITSLDRNTPFFSLFNDSEVADALGIGT